MKFAYSSSIFRLRPLTEAIDGIAKSGFQAIELIADRPHAFPEDLTAAELTKLNEHLSQRKLKVCNLNSCILNAGGEPRNPSWIDEDWHQRERRIRYTLDCLRLSAVMGVSQVSIDAGSGIPESMNYSEAWDLFIAGMIRILPLAQKLGRKVLILPRPNGLVETTGQTLALLKELKEYDCLSVSFDVGHLFCAGEEPSQSWEELKQFVSHIHLEDAPETRLHRHIQLGEGAIDIVGFLNRVRDSGYDGYITIKLDSYDQRAEEVVAASAKYLQSRGFPLD